MSSSLQDLTGSTVAPHNVTDTIVNKKEMRIETVIIILWASGGVLLLVLMVLLVCILKTNRKTLQGRRENSNIFRIGVDQTQPGGGGVNPAFTNYDEIWTWIPVVRGNQDECQGGATGTREDNSAESNEALSRTLEPPPYSVAITSPSYPPGGATYTTAAASSSESSRYLYSVSNENSNVLPSRNQSSYNTACTTTIVRPIVSTSESVSDISNPSGGRGNNSDITSRHHQNDHRNIAKTDIQTGRDFQRTWDVRDPWRRAETQSDVTHDIDPRISGCQYRDVTRALGCTHYVRHTRNQNRDNRQHNSVYVSENNQTPNNHCQDDVQSLYPELFGPEILDAQAQRMSREFVYDADAGLYSFTTENNGRRVWCDIPPSLLDEEGPPPYTPPPDYPGHRIRQQRRERSRSRTKSINSATDRPAPIVRLEYDYF